ncbi:MAG: hypothetical protein HYX60_12200 [Legionella longbeachae]|nr:hypothetical protein [Legionella longbeachae]
MKDLLGVLFVCFILISSTAFATDKTIMKSNWTCSTNASSSDKSSDKAVDKKMSDHAASAKKSFEFATKHCRDCTKITCEAK